MELNCKGLKGTRSLAITILHCSLVVAGLEPMALGQVSSAPAPLPPKSWVDAETGHRIFRLSDERGATAMYFNQNIFTPDGKDMIYLSTAGIHVVHLASMESKLLYAGHVTDVMMGPLTRRVFFRETHEGKLSVVDIDTGAVRKLGWVPLRSFISSINSDETRVVGTYIDGDFPNFTDYYMKEMHADIQSMQDTANRSSPGSNSFVLLKPAHAHAVAMQKYFDAHNPEVLFTLDLATGETKIIVRGNDWLAHPQFSPTDPNLIMFAHEGPSDRVDRVWTVRTDDGSKPRLFMSRSGEGVVTHEFWDPTGKTIWFDRQLEKGQDFTLTGLEVKSGAQTSYKVSKAEASLHYNLSKDGKLFCGDGNVMTHGDIGVNGHRTLNRAWIELLRPNADGTLHSTRLVSLTKHDYSKLEPNPHITPDNKYVIFTSNMLGTEAVFAVEIAKQATPPADATATTH